jgi:dTDP-4-amino-4,6-dideoxygalactose transaminase
MIRYAIPFNRPCSIGNELAYIKRALQSGQLCGDGEFTESCHSLLEKELGVPKVLLTPSGTHALEMAAILLGIQPGDEVIVPSFTFTSTANAFVLRGARPVFADIRPDTLNLDEQKLEQHITGRARAVIPVHYGGIGCEMDNILSIAARHGVVVIEDNAHGLFGRYKGKYLGTLGALAAQSFHETKNFSCGEGGALLINESRYIERGEIIREKGTDRSRFFRGEVDKYGWMDIGSSYLPSELQAAVLFAQLECKLEIQSRRRRIWAFYYDHLKDWAESRGIGLPNVPEHCEQSYHLFYLLTASLDQRSALIRWLRDAGILGVFHYLPLHLSEMGRRFGGRSGDCPVAESVSGRLLRLPFYNDLSEADQARVVEVILAFDKG